MMIGNKNIKMIKINDTTLNQAKVNMQEFMLKLILTNLYYLNFQLKVRLNTFNMKVFICYASIMEDMVTLWKDT